MSGELTLLVIRLVFLAIMWIFVFSIVYALRSDLFGSRSRDYQQAMAQSRQQTFAAAGSDSGSSGSPAPAPAPAGAPASAASQPQTQPAPPPQAPAAASGASGTSGQPQRLTKLVITSGPKRGFEIELGTEPLSIGRARDADVCIQDDYTSTRHARLLNWDGAWMLQDLDSTNGTFINGERVSQPVELRSGVPVRIGTTTFELR
ncbi:FHA domain-containing protein FhaB/FipA [Gulosibacter molinativorax]|uniref:FHA domain-containing protein n=1 Tax=Gulosibacter molinativorax TaxID=256821 RepID=A0ABT7C852_9MICO|nr:FHA domain-containing protein [Gulosibacter molinativorax]MDJ1371250.1 FHA domain-containing protein [Gulosibacter molinativorax]QUY63066.1 FHA domain-containing protein FhaB [Gulosibacter molinativorax]